MHLSRADARILLRLVDEQLGCLRCAARLTEAQEYEEVALQGMRQRLADNLNQHRPRRI